MTQTAAKPQPEVTPQPAVGEPFLPESPVQDSRELEAERFRLLWERRRFLLRASAIGLLASTLVAFLIPKSYTSTAQLMPPDQQSSSALALMAGMAGMASKTSSGLGAMAGDLLGIKSSGALFVGVLRSQTAQDRLIQQFDLRRVYGKRLLVDARKKLDDSTSISEDRKSGIISISVTDNDPERAAGLANAYADQLNKLVAQLSTSSAHRERVFLEDRLKFAKRDLDEAANQLAQFSSKNSTLDIEQEGKAMLDAAATIAGQLIVAQSQLEGLREIYTDNNSRVRAMQARVSELRRQLEKLGGTQNIHSKKLPALSAAKVQASGASPGRDADPPADPSLNQSARAAQGQVGDPPSSQIRNSVANQAEDTRSGQAADLTADASADQVAMQSADMPYPTIRSLPLLGAKYADFYRRAKIQETVFELLTQQYELAKVQEAKETPSVKVLDPGTVPERKSFPPRILIIVLSTFLAMAGSVVWVLGINQWRQADPSDPRKILAQEVVATMRARLPWITRNGHGKELKERGVSDAVTEVKGDLGADGSEEKKILRRLDR